MNEKLIASLKEDGATEQDIIELTKKQENRAIITAKIQKEYDEWYNKLKNKKEYK